MAVAGAPRCAVAAGRRELNVEEYVEGVLAGQRAALGRAITLVESRRAEHRTKAQEVLVRLLPHAGRAHRIGITGVPGVGKSTFIETLGIRLTGDGHRVAVLAIDPTSNRTGGSILGDKTRMQRLGADPNAFIRPSPTSGTLGGVARKTRETMLICETAGYDVVIVETVGVGQSETVVADMVDFFLVLMLAGAGDELQGIKKGVLELADMIAVNKADGDNVTAAKCAAVEYVRALHIIKPGSPNWTPPVVTCSAMHGKGLDEVWQRIEEHRVCFQQSGEFKDKRHRQQLGWMWAMLDDRLMTALRTHPTVARELPVVEREVLADRLTPALAVERVLKAFGL